MTAEPTPEERLPIVSGPPSAARILLCLTGATGTMSLVFTAAFVVLTADEMTSAVEALWVIAALLAFWAPVWCWAAWYISVPAVLAVGIGAAFLTHRCRVTGTHVRRGGVLCRVSAALILIVGGWALVLGVVELTLSIR